MFNFQIDCSGNNLEVFGQNGEYFNYCDTYEQDPQIDYIFTAKKASMIQIKKKQYCSFCRSSMAFSFKFEYLEETITTIESTLLTTTSTTLTTSTTPTASTAPTTTIKIARECGIPAVTSNSMQQLKIIGGEIAKPNSWPWQVYIQDCAATLIDNQVVLN